MFLVPSSRAESSVCQASAPSIRPVSNCVARQAIHTCMWSDAYAAIVLCRYMLRRIRFREVWCLMTRGALSYAAILLNMLQDHHDRFQQQWLRTAAASRCAVKHDYAKNPAAAGCCSQLWPLAQQLGQLEPATQPGPIWWAEQPGHAASRMEPAAESPTTVPVEYVTHRSAAQQLLQPDHAD